MKKNLVVAATLLGICAFASLLLHPRSERVSLDGAWIGESEAQLSSSGWRNVVGWWIRPDNADSRCWIEGKVGRVNGTTLRAGSVLVIGPGHPLNSEQVRKLGWCSPDDALSHNECFVRECKMQDWIVPGGEEVLYNTRSGEIQLICASDEGEAAPERRRAGR